MHPVAWDEASLTDLETGSVDRPLPAGAWQVPNVIELDSERDRLVWTWSFADNYDLRDSVCKPGPGMLDAFVRLAGASPERIRDFARHWGQLGICEHGLPHSHNPRVYPDPASTHYLFSMGLRSAPPAAVDWGCGPMRCAEDDHPYDDYWFWEPLGPWRWFSGQARAVLNMIAAVQRGRDVEPTDVHAAHAHYARLGHVPKSPDATRLLIANVVDEWLLLARVRPAIRWLDGPAATLTLGDGRLFGALGIALAMQAARTDGLAICSACGNAYTPPRRPRADQRNYCEPCRGAGAPQRDADRARRERAKQAISRTRS